MECLLYWQYHEMFSMTYSHSVMLIVQSSHYTATRDSTVAGS